MPNVSFINLVKANIHNKKITATSYHECSIYVRSQFHGATNFLQLKIFEFVFKCEPVWTRFALWQLTAVVNYKEVKNLSILNHDEQPQVSGDQSEMLMLFKTSQFLFSCQFVSILDKLYTLLLSSWTFPEKNKVLTSIEIKFIKLKSKLMQILSLPGIMC